MQMPIESARLFFGTVMTLMSLSHVELVLASQFARASTVCVAERRQDCNRTEANRVHPQIDHHQIS